MAKSRVAPIKTMSISRLDLTAAVVAVNVTTMFKNELNYDNLQTVFYTDSEVVLGYMNNVSILTLGTESNISEIAPNQGSSTMLVVNTTQLVRLLMVRSNKRVHPLKLDPFIDLVGLLRVGSRIRRASLPYDVKHPVNIPKSSHITELIIRHFHYKIVHHQGRGITLNAI